jgi:hypothetical protein
VTYSPPHVSRVSSVPSAGAPAAARAVWFVALRELTDQMTSLRFLIIALLAIGLTPLAVYVGTRDYNNRLTDYDRLLAEQQKVAGDQKGVYDRGELLPLRVVRPPEALSVVVRGLDGAIPAYWDFSTAGIASGPSASRPRRLADMLGQLDLEFLVRVVLGLLIVYTGVFLVGSFVAFARYDVR